MSDTLPDRSDAQPPLLRFVTERHVDVVMPPWVAVHHAPQAPGLYFCWALDGQGEQMDRPVYIGASISLRARLRGWFGNDGMRRPWPERIRWITMDLLDSSDLVEAEAGEIRCWQPIRNAQGVERPYARGPWS